MADITIDQLETQTFYQIPQIFVANVEKKYGADGQVIEKIKSTSVYARELSNDAKLAYGVLYNRCLLSIRSYHQGKTDYVDANGSVFLVYTVEDLQDVLDKGKTTVHKIKKELKDVGLLREVAQGANRPNRLYLQNVDASLQEYEYYAANVVSVGRDKGKIIYTHIKTTNSLGNVIFYSSPGVDDNGGSKSERPTKLIKSTKNGGSKNGRPNNEQQGVQNPNGSKNDKNNNELLDNSSRKAEKISEEISSPPETDSTPIQNQSLPFIKPQYYSLLQVIADRYNDRLFCFPDVVTLTHQQKMKVGEYLETGYVISDEVLSIIDRIPSDCQSPLAYLYKSLENLKEERRLEAKLLAHRQAEQRYG
ncbi:replication initiator protein A [Streptococcus canis]|uniref:Gp49 bacteriophage-like protein n=1 Tax=Streptococcus canis FSL Z3-227 TaxID=482234 RepID=A0AAV3FU69_STRCB|nr:replication initiator protein A [Streptococcus canis]EIQ82695.1 gp49 bacteriophage-like protein [Streptococcus canis FSL Z3-227]